MTETGYRRTPRAGLTALPGGGGGLPLADPAGAGSATERNPIKDDDSTYTVLTVPADTVIFGVKLEGDDHPRFAIAVDPTNFGSVFLGDGTADPVNGDSPSAAIYMTPGGGIALGGTAPAQINRGLLTGGDVDFSAQGNGPILVADDDSRHRVVVAADGTLSTVPLV